MKFLFIDLITIIFSPIKERMEHHGAPLRVSCLLDALRLPPVELRGHLLMQCMDERDRRTFRARALLTGAALYLLLPPNASAGRLSPTWRILPLQNAAVNPARLEELKCGPDGRFYFDVSTARVNA